jgi:glycosyltransferase involved in cell wall biosynthesis
MKIAVWYNLPSGGAKRALYDHILGLKRLGHEVESWRPPVEQRSYLDLAKVIPEHEVPLDFVERDSSFYPSKIYLSATRSDRLSEAMEKHSRQCAKEISAGGFDLLFANTDVFFHTPHIGRYLDIPKALYVAEPNRPLYEAMPRLPWLMPEATTEPPGPVKKIRRLGRNYVETRNARVLATAECESALHYDRILVNSYYSRETVLRTYGIDAHVCYLGIDASLFENRHLAREPFVMSVGSMIPAKNPHLLIRAVARIPRERRPKFVWPFNFGNEEFVAETLALAKSLDVDFDARKLVTDEELVSLLNRASAFLYAPRLEPFGLAPLEANACGAPIVAVAEGGVRETVEDGVNGLLSPSDPVEIAEAIDRLILDPSLARRLGETGAELVRTKWSVDAGVDRLERHLKLTLEDARDRRS